MTQFISRSSCLAEARKLPTKFFLATRGYGELPIFRGTAAAFAESALNANTPYLWDGKGYDYWVQRGFVDNLASPYHWNPLPGHQNDEAPGLDCSGLALWSYDKAAGSTQIFNSSPCPNPICYEGAGGQFDSNSVNIDDADLPGDLLFFNYCHRKGTLPSFCAAESDGKVLLDADHEAIYIGSFGGGCTLPDGSTGDVIQASGLPIAHGTAGVICSKKSTMVSYAQSIGAFKGFGRRVPAKVGIRFATGSPVSLRVTDPQGFTIDGTTELTTDFEILHKVPGQLYYSHLSTQNGTVDDVVVGPTLKAGAYSVKVIAKPDALPTDTYSLTVDAGGSSLSLASNVLISAIPSGGYTLASTGSTAQTCDVTYNGTFNGNLTISRGVTCVSNGTITGNLTQEGGLFVRGATIAGNLRINSGIFSIGAGTTIKGNLQIQNIPAGSTGAQICELP